MQNKELRFGNLIRAKSDKVIEVVSDLRTNSINACSLGYFEGIPLTEEWLVKFGLYKKDWAEGVVYELKFTLEQRKDGWHLCDNDFIGLQPIKYIHQLQNLHFALTGEELSLK